MLALSSSQFVKAFGSRPIATLRLPPGPSSESLQGGKRADDEVVSRLNAGVLGIYLAIDPQRTTPASQTQEYGGLAEIINSCVVLRSDLASVERLDNYLQPKR